LLLQVNKQLAARLLAQEEEAAAAAAAAADGSQAPGPPAKRRKGDLGVNPMADDRFKSMFEDEEFAIDEESAEYRLLHPNAAKVRVLGRRGRGR
jgi:ribosome biogenesis protein ENP2